MLDIVVSNQFKKDLKQISKRGYDLNLLNDIVGKLALQEKLDAQFRDHALTGNYSGFRECHIKSDWLLIYRINNNELYLFLSRTGTHSDLF
ncbi:MAG: type II toxin-antitoxin system YafQ family toxin [Ruminococcus sp.]|nr:type II toxin-antitoxin system YafQ family toxin [Ruminococcus sp.]